MAKVHDKLTCVRIYNGHKILVKLHSQSIFHIPKTSGDRKDHVKFLSVLNCIWNGGSYRQVETKKLSCLEVSCHRSKNTFRFWNMYDVQPILS